MCCDLALQALAELYHIQAPLFGIVPQPASDTCHAPPTWQNAAQLATPHMPDINQAPDHSAAADLAESFISTQQMGIKDASGAASIDPTSVLEGAANSGRIAESQAVTPDLPHASSSQVGASTPRTDLVQTGPLCSQEWKIQHVRLHSHQINAEPHIYLYCTSIHATVSYAQHSSNVVLPHAVHESKLAYTVP